MTLGYVVLMLSFMSSNGMIQKLNSVEEGSGFIALGDWGGRAEWPYTTHEQTRVAAQMQAYSTNQNVSFVLSLGDNFYPAGISSGQDVRFKQTFENVYLRGNLRHVPWYVVAGNHDYRTKDSVQHQIDYSARSNGVWNFPSPLYAFNFELRSSSSNSSKLIHFIQIDTVLLCGLHDAYYANTLNQDYYKQLVALLDAVKLSKSDLIFLVGHHPVYTAMSSRKHSSCINKHLLRLMEIYSISAYLGGHDHTLQYHTYSNKLHFFISGAGRSMYKKPHVAKVDKESKFSTEFYWSRVEVENNHTSQKAGGGGFLAIALYLNQYTATFFDSRGNQLFAKSIQY